MSIIRSPTLICDRCQRRADKVENGWMVLYPIDMEDTTIHSDESRLDFCSLACLRAFAEPQPRRKLDPVTGDVYEPLGAKYFASDNLRTHQQLVQGRFVTRTVPIDETKE